MSKTIDLTGYKTGLITVLERAGSAKGQATWLCQCACGKKFIQYGGPLRSGKVKSCGHLWKSRAERQKIAYNSIAKTKHGGSADRLYFVWASIKNRCYYKGNPTYPIYGGRGITVCDEWKNDYSAFRDWAMKTGYDEKAPRNQCTIDRIDPNGNYCPENCRWTNAAEQSNNRRNSYTITWNGETHHASEWSKITGLSQSLIYTRYKSGWEPEKIFTTPVRKHK